MICDQCGEEMTFLPDGEYRCRCGYSLVQVPPDLKPGPGVSRAECPGGWGWFLFPSWMPIVYCECGLEMIVTPTAVG